MNPGVSMVTRGALRGRIYFSVSFLCEVKYV